MQLANGSQLGPYRIVSPIGAGGMGEVYRAVDTRLGRDVAIKVLGGDVAASPHARSRLEKEARAISHLAHPNICTLYDIGQLNGAPFLVMEYLQGETLENRLKRGPLPVAAALEIATNIAVALDKAHQQQILHRDLKPSNIMLTKSGARLFDFGLAKIAEEAAASSQTSTVEKSLTGPGRIAGTPAYMSPEQLQGKEPDARSDIFSFGVVLYQMLTGRRPFEAKTVATITAAILDHDPDPPSRLRSDLPPDFDWLTRHCLAKNPDDRFDSAHDLVIELERIRQEPSGRSAAPSARRRSAAAAIAAVAVILAIGFTAGRILRSRPTVARGPVRHFSIALPASAPVAPGDFEKLAVSPDGTRIVYVGGSDPTRLYLDSLETLEAKPLPGTEGARGPFFSPRGDWVGFYTDDNELKKVALPDGQPVRLSAAGNLRGAAWGPDDTIVIAQPRSPLQRISASSGAVSAIPDLVPNGEVRWPSWLSGGNTVLCTINDLSGNYENARLALVSLQSGRARDVIDHATFGRYVEGLVVYSVAHGIYAVPFDVGRQHVSGTPALLVSDVDTYSTTGLAHFAVSSDGSLFYLPTPLDETERELVWVSRSGAATPVARLRRAYSEPKLSPDGKTILVDLGTPPRVDLWSYNSERDAWTRLTSEAINYSPVWSPDGTQIAFASTRGGGPDLYIMPSDGSTSPKRMTGQKRAAAPSDWSRDGILLLSEQGKATVGHIVAMPAHGRTAPAPLLSDRFDEGGAVFSPDQRWIAYRSNESGRDEIYLQTYPPQGRKELLSVGGGTNPIWRRDGRELFYRSGDRVMAVDVRLGSAVSTGKPHVLFSGDFEPEFDVSITGDRFLMVKRAQRKPQTQINVVLGALSHP